MKSEMNMNELASEARKNVVGMNSEIIVDLWEWMILNKPEWMIAQCANNPNINYLKKWMKKKTEAAN